MKKIISIFVIILMSFGMAVPVNATELGNGQIGIDKIAEIIDEGNGLGYSRTAKVELKISGGSGYSVTEPIEVILILDKSSSMDGAKMQNTKAAAIAFINQLLTEDTINVKVGIIVFGTGLISYKDLTTDGESLTTFINNLSNSNSSTQGTNVHAGLLKAYQLLDNKSNANKSVVLLSDGQPNRSMDGVNSDYSNIDDTFLQNSSYISNNSSNASSRPKDVATNIKKSKADGGLGATVYTIGFDISTGNSNSANGQARALLDEIQNARFEGHYPAEDKNDLDLIFSNLAKEISMIAKDVVITDIIPAGFILEESDEEIIARLEAKKEIQKVTIVHEEDGTTTIKIEVGEFKANDNLVIDYNVKATGPNYGSMYTNKNATLTGTANDGNTFYGDSKEINLKFPKPVVPIPGITSDDNYAASNKYDVKEGAALQINKDLGILINDGLLKNNNNGSVVDEIIIVKTNKSVGELIVNADGSFTYTAPDDFEGLVTFDYYVKTIITIDDKTYTVYSNTSTISLNVVKKSLGKVIVRHIDEKGKLLAKEIITEDKVDEAYSTSSKEFAGYYLLEVKGEEKGIYKEKDTVITYIYKKTAVYTGIDSNNNYEILGSISLLSLSLLIIKRKKLLKIN